MNHHHSSLYSLYYYPMANTTCILFDVSDFDINMTGNPTTISPSSSINPLFSNKSTLLYNQSLLTHWPSASNRYQLPLPFHHSNNSIKPPKCLDTGASGSPTSTPTAWELCPAAAVREDDFLEVCLIVKTPSTVDGYYEVIPYAHAQVREDLHSGRIFPYTKPALHWR